MARADPSGARVTRDVDIRVLRADLEHITAVLESEEFNREDLRIRVLFIDHREPDRRAGVHLVWPDAPDRRSYICAAPSLYETIRIPGGFAILDLPSLVRMNLTSFGDIDRVHVKDMLSVGLIDERIRENLPSALLNRLCEV